MWTKELPTESGFYWRYKDNFLDMAQVFHRGPRKNNKFNVQSIDGDGVEYLDGMEGFFWLKQDKPELPE